MRVLHVITSLEVGGSQVALLRLISALRFHGVESRVISLRSGGGLRPRFAASDVDIHELDVTPTSVVREVARLHSLLRRYGADVLHGWLYHANVLAALARVGLPDPPPLVWSIRSDVQRPRQAGMSTGLATWASKKLSAWPTAIVFNSQAGRRSHARYGFRTERSDFIPNGFHVGELPPEHVARDERARLGVLPSEILVALVGRHHPVKNHALLLDAAARARRRVSSLRFLLVGEGVEKLRPQVERAGLGEAVILQGYTLDLTPTLAASDLLAVTSRSEAFPNVIGEAMAAGVPCLSTDVGDCADVIGNTGWVVPPGDASKLSEALVRFCGLTADERRLWGCRARERIAARYSVETTAAAYLRLYELVAGVAA